MRNHATAAQWHYQLANMHIHALQHKTLDIVTVFHKASSPASVRVANLVKQVSANAQAGATEDQASDHSAQDKVSRSPFELNVTEDPPTADQVSTILDYVGSSGVSKVIKDAKDEKDALKKFKENKDSFLRPVVSRQWPFHIPRQCIPERFR